MMLVHAKLRNYMHEICANQIFKDEFQYWFTQHTYSGSALYEFGRHVSCTITLQFFYQTAVKDF